MALIFTAHTIQVNHVIGLFVYFSSSSAHRACCVLLLAYFTQWKQSPWKISAVSGKKKKRKVDCIFCQLVVPPYVILRYSVCEPQRGNVTSYLQRSELGVTVASRCKLAPLCNTPRNPHVSCYVYWGMCAPNRNCCWGFVALRWSAVD